MEIFTPTWFILLESGLESVRTKEKLVHAGLWVSGKVSPVFPIALTPPVSTETLILVPADIGLPLISATVKVKVWLP